jgi:2-hydroxychromene-2-carboxylate isomerase
VPTVEFWFDPACPFTWRTSRWLADVAARRGVEVRWKLMSLALLKEGEEIPEEHREPMRQGARALRVLAAAQRAGGAPAVGALYAVLGAARHEKDQPYDDQLFEGAVREVGLPAEVAEAGDDEAFDDAIRTGHEEAQRRVGTEAGSPVLAIDGGRGYFGPVVVPVPTGEEADRLFDGVRLLSSVPAFSELKTARAAI